MLYEIKLILDADSEFPDRVSIAVDQIVKAVSSYNHIDVIGSKIESVQMCSQCKQIKAISSFRMKSDTDFYTICISCLGAVRRRSVSRDRRKNLDPRPGWVGEGRYGGWTREEEQGVIDSVDDIALSYEIERTVSAIRARRAYLKSRGVIPWG